MKSMYFVEERKGLWKAKVDDRGNTFIVASLRQKHDGISVVFISCNKLIHNDAVETINDSISFTSARFPAFEDAKTFVRGMVELSLTSYPKIKV